MSRGFTHSTILRSVSTLGYVVSTLGYVLSALSCSGARLAEPAYPAAAPREAAAVAGTPAGAAPAGAAAAGAPAAPPGPTAAAEERAPAAPPAGATRDVCGPFECWRFDAGARALDAVLADQPLALGIGEAHALAGTEGVASTARRFAEELLPSLSGRASHLVVELLNPDPRCEGATRAVREKQAPVTAPQSTQNQNDYVALGHRARSLDIEPFVLSPTCDEFQAIAGAGDAAIDVMLETIARVTSRMLRAALVKNQSAGRPALVIGYGGALHNDIEPAEAKARWSYGPDLATFTRGRYVELDLIVRDFVKDTDAWRALPWYPHYDPKRFEGQWLVMRTAPRRYVLFFPRQVLPQQVLPQQSTEGATPPPSAP